MTARGPLVRLALVVLGVTMVGFGLIRLLAQGPTRALGAGVWLAAVVAVHDGVLVPVVLAAGVGLAWLAGAGRWRGGSVGGVGRWRGPVTGGLVVLATVTVVAVPAWGRYGARADNPTLLDRDYAWGWAALAATIVVVTLAVLAVCHARSQVSKGGPDVPDPGR